TPTEFSGDGFACCRGALVFGEHCPGHVEGFIGLWNRRELGEPHRLCGRHQDHCGNPCLQPDGDHVLGLPTAEPTRLLVPEGTDVLPRKRGCQYLGGSALAADRVDVPLVNQRRLRGNETPPVLGRPLSCALALLLLPAQRPHHRTHDHDHHERNSGIRGQRQKIHRTLTLPGTPPHLRCFMPTALPSPRRIAPSDHRSTPRG